MLLIGAGLFLRSLQQAQTMDPGFGKDPAALATVALSTKRYSEDGRPSLHEAATGSNPNRYPEFRTWGSPKQHAPEQDGRRTWQSRWTESIRRRDDKLIRWRRRMSDPGFFDAVGIPILRGRNFDGRIEPTPSQWPL